MKKRTFEPTYWIEKAGFPNRKEYDRLLEVEDKQDQIFSFSWASILFLLILLVGVVFLILIVK